MSNYAPSPSKKPIYQNLATKSLSEVTALEIQQITDPVKLAAINQDALIVNNIVNEAAMRNGSPMPNTGNVERYSQTGDNNSALVRPPKGEVWKIQGISVRNTVAPTGSNTYYTFLSDQTSLDSSPTIPAVVNEDVYYSVLSSSSQYLPVESMFEEVFQPFIIDHNMFVRLWNTFDNQDTGNVTKYLVGYVRLR